MTLTAVLLAGGLSRRMGRDKATLVLDNQPLWSRQLRLLRGLNPASVLISARALPAWAPGEVPIVLDRPPSRGPLSGIAAALERMETSHLLALAVDLPNMTSAHLEKLASLVRPSCGVVPRTHDYFEPLAALYPKEAEPFAQQALSSTDLSLQSFAGELLSQNLVQPYDLPVSELGCYRNLNTIED